MEVPYFKLRKCLVDSSVTVAWDTLQAAQPELKKCTGISPAASRVGVAHSLSSVSLTPLKKVGVGAVFFAGT